jgi:hypothetical protein
LAAFSASLKAFFAPLLEGLLSPSVAAGLWSFPSVAGAFFGFGDFPPVVVVGVVLKFLSQTSLRNNLDNLITCRFLPHFVFLLVPFDTHDFYNYKLVMNRQLAKDNYQFYQIFRDDVKYRLQVPRLERVFSTPGSIKSFANFSFWIFLAIFALQYKVQCHHKGTLSLF